MKASSSVSPNETLFDLGPVGGDEVANPGLDMGAEARSVKDAVMADLGLHICAFLGLWQFRA